MEIVVSQFLFNMPIRAIELLFLVEGLCKKPGADGIQGILRRVR